MTSHKHSFQCFDAVLEKPSSTTVHNCVVHHKSPFTSTHLEQLENRRCSLCSESQQAKPVTSEVTGNQSASWYQSQSPRHQHTPRRPMRPEGDPVYGVAHHHHNHHQRHHQNHIHRHCKRIVLVKNSNPSIQKTILLHRKPVHSLAVFMDDVSELMQCLIRKLYTLDGHKVDSVQSLLQGPGVLVCVGREPFHPLLLDGFQRNSEDKLPKLILKSKSSTCNEDQGYKKNVNFGLNSKKSVPPDPFPKAREKILDDDIKKRVLVNKDGSLSVEMKVRFRLLNDETLHCSTEVKKSSCTFNVSFPGQDNVSYPHCGHGESCSEAESLSASEADDVYFTRLYQKHMEEPHCQHCCTHCQEYDIWKNPALGEQETRRHFGSTSSSASSRKIKCKKESVDSVHTTSCEEYTEQVVENSTCIQQTVGERYKGDNKVQYCTISRCCSRSEVCSVSTKAKISGCTDEKYGQTESNHAFTEEEKRPFIDHMSVQITQASTVDERPLSVETDSSDILASLKEDEDKEETDLSYSQSNSRVSQSNNDTDEQTRNAVVGPYSFTPYKPPESPKQSLSTRTSSTASCCSVKSKTSRKAVVTETQENVELDKYNPPSSTPHNCQYIESPDVAIEKGTSEEKLVAIKQSEDFDENDALHTEAFRANEKGRSNATSMTPNPLAELLANGIGDQTEAVLPHILSKESKSSQISDLETSELREMEDQIEDRSSSIMSVKSFISEATPVKLVKEQSAESLTSALSVKTNMSAQSITSKISKGTPVDMENKLLIERVPSAMSAKSAVSLRSKTSNILHISPHESDVEDAIEDPASSPKPNKSNTSSRSVKPTISTVAPKEADDVEEERLKRPSSNMSSKSSASVRSTKSNLRDERDNTEKTKHLHDGYITSVILSKPSDSELFKKSKTSKATLEKSGDFEHHSEEQVPSTKSTKSSKSEMLETCMGENEGRPLSAMSSKSNVSKKSGKSKLSESAWEGDHPEERPASIMSSTSVKYKMSVVSDALCENEEEEPRRVRSQRSRKSKASDNPRQDTGNEGNREGASSTMSCQSILSDRSNLALDGGDDTGPKEHSLKEAESAYEETKNDKAASAMSSKSQMSSLYNKSKDRIQERAPSSMSAKSNVSSKSKNSKTDQSKDEGEHRVLILASPSSKKSARSKKSETLTVVSPVEVENQSSERTPSAMSGKSNTSKSKKNTVSDCFKEPQKSNEEELVERSPSAVSVKSNTSVRSKGSDTQSNRPMNNIHLNIISPKSITSAKDNCSIISNNSTNVDTVRSEETWEINVEERAPSDMCAKPIVSSRSVKSNISALAGGHTEIPSFNERSCNALSGLKVSMTENSNNADERASSALFAKFKTSSVQHTSERVLSPASASVSIGIVEEYDFDNAEDNGVSLVSVNSSPGLNSKTDECCKDSSEMNENENQHCMQTPDDRAKSSLTAVTIVSDISKKPECTHKNFSQPIADNRVATNKSAQKNSKKSSSHTLNSRPAHSYFGASKSKDRNCPAITDRPKTNMSNTLLCLEVNGQSKENSHVSSDRYEEELSRLHDVPTTDNGLLRHKSKEPVISLGVPNHRPTPSNEKANKLNTTRDLNVRGGTCNGSLVATDCSRNANDNNSEKNSNSSCRHSSSSLAQMEDINTFELVPSILPSSSPTEVVNEWLKKIPLDSALYDVGDEFHENCEEELLKMSGKVAKYERGNGSEGDADAAVLRPQNEQLQGENIENNESKVGDVRKTAKNLVVVENIQPCTFPDVPSSVQLMRILLSPKLDRCNSLPEVSPVYGRKLSMSARGFLDSLVNLQLLDFDPNDVNGKAEKYNDLMTMFQSLWLSDPSDNQQSNAEEFNVKSSSEVEIDRSCQDSLKSSVNECSVFKVAQKSQTNTEGEDIEIQEIDKTEKAFKGIETKSDSATPDIASRVRWTPENEAEENMQESNILSVLTIRNNFSTIGPPDTASISNKSSGHDSNANQKLTDHEEDTSSESSSSEQMTQLTEKVSQDPDPVWVLNLLNKIEKQFMTHYVTAMAEFKVRWNLNDNEQLDVMICELKDEVHKRIQASINSELRKIKGHAGRPRPPKETMPRESSFLNEQRRRRVKVSHSQSIDLAAKTDDSAADLMAELSDRRNNDEYCPCDTCMKKKTSRPVEVLNSASVMMDFDLRKFLHFKREAPLNSKENVKENEEHHIEIGNLTENHLLESFKKDKTQELYKANVELQAMSTESIRTSSLEQNESGNGNEILEMTNAEAIAEEEHAHSGPAHTETEAKITEDEVEICDELAEQKESVEDEPVREAHTTEAGTAKENMAIKAGAAGEQEAAEGESERKRTEAETSDTETRGETDEAETLDKKESLGERISEDNEAVDGEISESESEGGEILDDEKEKHKDAKTEPKWKNMSVKPDIAVDAGSTEGDAAEKEIDTTVTDEPKIKSEIGEDDKEKSDGIEDGTGEEYESVEAEQSESTDDEERDANKAVEEDVAIKKISKESGEGEEKKNEHAEDGHITEQESAEEDNSMNDESGNGEETDNVEGTTSKPETEADEEPADNETAEYRENFYDGTSDRSETEEDGEPYNSLTTEDGETIGAKVADVGKMGEAKAAEDNDYESAEDAETSQSQTAEDTSDDETAEYRERPEAKIAEGGEISDDGIAYDGGADDAVTGEDERGENGDTDEDEISEIEEMPCNETVDSEITTKDKTTEFEETQNESTSDDGEDAGAVVADDEEAAEVPEENGNNTDDDKAEESERAKTEVAEEIADNEIAEDTEGNVMKTEGEAQDNEKTADGRENHDTAEDTEMDTSQSEQDGVTADDEADNGEIDDDRTTEDEEPSESDMEKVDKTEKDREQEDDGRTDEQKSDEVTDDEATVGTDSEEDEETTEANTGEDGQTADNRTTEDGDTADETKAEDEDLSENEIAQNGEIAERITEEYGQMDERLKNGETAGEVNVEALENNPAEAVINTDVVKGKQMSEMSINQETGTFESNRYNVNTPLINTGESDEGGDEAEDETEPAVETNGRAQPAKWPLPKADERTIASFDSAVKVDPGSEDGADADGEDSEPEGHKDGSVENEEDN